MAVNVPTLQSIVPGAFLSLGFHEAEPYAGNAATYFDSEVKRVIDAGQVWSGEGQPQAAAVLQTNSLALEACKLQMRAGMAATDGLYRALTKAKQELENVLSEIGADENGTYSVENDGTVKYAKFPTNSLGSDYTNDVPDLVYSVEPEITFRVQQILNYANSADLTGAALLARIADACPTFTENVSPQALAYNEAVRELAHGNLKLAELSRDLWEDASPGTWGGEITPLSEAWLNAADNPPLRAYNDLPSGHPLNILVEPPLLAAGGIWGLLGVYSNTRPENRIPELDEPSNLLALKPTVDDGDLQGIIDDLYSALPLTPAEAARLQSAAGSDVVGEDGMDRVRDVRERLREWLGESHDELAEDVEPTAHTEWVPLGGSHLTPTRVPDPHTPEYYDPEDFAISPADRKTARQLYQQLSAVLTGPRRGAAKD